MLYIFFLGQAIVGDKTVAFLLMDEEMYFGMSCLADASPIVERGIALHKVVYLGFCSKVAYLIIKIVALHQHIIHIKIELQSCYRNTQLLLHYNFLGIIIISIFCR